MEKLPFGCTNAAVYNVGQVCGMYECGNAAGTEAGEPTNKSNEVAVVVISESAGVSLSFI